MDVKGEQQLKEQKINSIKNFEESESKKMNFIGFIFLLFVLCWFLAGFIGFIFSLVCFGHSGSTFDKLLGLFLSSMFGPFYWIYYAYNSKYCK